MNNFLKIIFYYFIILISLFITLWIIWARFLRSRIIKDIPMMLTESGFWLLCYICFIYLLMCSFIVISLLKNIENKSNTNLVIRELMNKCYIPFIMLDHLVKYNKYFKDNYCKFQIEVLNFIQKFTDKKFINMILIFEIIPRIFLASFLILDTFYFRKLEILYKIISLGILPFVFKYFKYNFNDFKEHYIKLLENKFKYIYLLDEASAEDPNWVLTYENKFHDQDISIREYVEFKIKKQVYGIPDVTYNENPVAHDFFYDEYKQVNNIPENTILFKEDFKKIKEDFELNIKIICDSAVIYEKIFYFQNSKNILYLRVLIYTLYFVCWGHILYISYFTCPIPLPMFEFLVKNIYIYMPIYDNDPFSMLNQYSINTNLITLQSILHIIQKLFYILTKVL